MDFSYRIVKRNDHEASLNVVYTPVDDSLSPRTVKVFYDSHRVSGMSQTDISGYLRELIVQRAPIHDWQSERGATDCKGVLDGAIEFGSDQSVKAEEIKAAEEKQAKAVAEPLERKPKMVVI